MHDVTRALTRLKDQNQDWEKQPLLSFAEFLQEVRSQPSRIINIRGFLFCFLFMASPACIQFWS